jgi:hypothetical protein
MIWRSTRFLSQPQIPRQTTENAKPRLLGIYTSSAARTALHLLAYYLRVPCYEGGFWFWVRHVMWELDIGAAAGGEGGGNAGRALLPCPPPPPVGLLLLLAVVRQLLPQKAGVAFPSSL